MKYRPEIDGLRALAVIPVIFFHAGFSWFAGGYIGVDVFFVISGYLITGILLSGLKEGTFSLKYFYERRARRILPALYLVVICTMPLAWFVMMPSQLADFSQSLVAVSSFAANFFFYLKSGYFEPASELSPMLHIWSLAVEEQFYFVFPVFLMVIMRYGRRTTISMILLLFAVSLFYSHERLYIDPAASFFLPFGRAWELMVGALLNFLPRLNTSKRQLEDFGAGLGVVLIVASIVFLDANSPFPGVLALPPTVGTALIIYFARQSSGVGRFLSFRPVVGVGLISYSLYLWHQPLFAIARINTLGDPPAYVFLLLILVSLVLSYVSWRYVEKPFRNRREVSRKTLIVSSILAIGMVMGVGFIGHKTKGFREIKYRQIGVEFRDFENRLARLRKDRKQVWKDLLAEGNGDFSIQEDKLRVLVVGDSRSEDLYVSLMLNRDRFNDMEFRIHRLDETCFPAIARNSGAGLSVCGAEARAFINRYQRAEPDLVLVSCGWLEDSDEQLEYLLKFLNGVPCVVFGTASFNEIDSLFYTIYSRHLARSEWPAFFTQNVHTRSRNASHNLTHLTDVYNMRFVDAYAFFEVNPEEQSGETVYSLVTKDGDPLLIDQTHLTTEGARRFGRMIFDQSWLEHDQ